MKRTGAVLVFTAVMMTVLMGFAALAIDVGYMYAVQARRQNAADAAALAGAAVMFDEFGFNEKLTISSVQEYAKKNDFDDITINIKIGEFIGAKFVETLAPQAINSVQVTIERKEQLFFAGIFGITNAKIKATATAMRKKLKSTCVVPVALRNPDFGPVDPTIANVNPGKDGPSYPSNGQTFQIGEKVVLFAFGKGPRQPVHLVLDLWEFKGVEETNYIIDDTFGRGCIPLEIGDELPVWNNGTGDGNFGRKLIDRMTDNDLNNDTIVVPIMAILPDSRDQDGKITGNIKIIDFTGVHLEEVIEAHVTDSSGRILVINLLIGKITRMIVRGEDAIDQDLPYIVSSLKLVQ